MYLAHLEHVWPIEKPLSFSPLQGGVNNQVWKVAMAEGSSYVLRLIPDENYIAHIHYEIAVLKALSEKPLPFLLPIPIKTRNGDNVGTIKRENGEAIFALLTPLLPGYLHDRNPADIATYAAVALAQLDTALAELAVLDITEGRPLFSTFGELAHIHPLVSDPLATVERLPIDAAQALQIQHFLASVLEKVPDLYSRLPQQFVHRDYDAGNILVDEQRVTAVLDFEFVGFDLRVLDLCVALSWWPVNVMGTGKEWAVIDAFGSVYCTHFPLKEEELLAIPDVCQLRDAVSFIYRMGRYLAGQETDERIQGRLRHSLWREEWLANNREVLVQHVMAYRRNII
jgi:homoserine kinase type II